MIEPLAFFYNPCKNLAMIIRFIGILIGLTVLAGEMQAAEVSQDQLLQCQRIKEDPKRLACYDALTVTSNDQEQIHTTESKPNEFPVLWADLDETNLAFSVGQLDFLGEVNNAVLISAGNRLKIKDFNWGENQSLTFNAFGQIRSQFDVEELDTRNNRGGALINTDFSIGGELVKSMPHWNWRFAYTHRSTHLGDEFLIDNPQYLVERVNLSYETVKWTAHKNLNHWDVYAGVGLVTRSEPSDLGKTMYQLGWQFRGDRLLGVTPIWAVDLTSWAAYDRKIRVNMRAGIEIDQWTTHPFQLLLEYQEGQSPYGQFYDEDLTFTGLTLLQNW